MLKAAEDWFRQAVIELFPYLVLYFPFLLIRVVAKASDRIIARLDATQHELESIRESIETMSNRVSPTGEPIPRLK